MPAYNEALTVVDLLERVLVEPTQKEVIVVDDGSTDGTDDILTSWFDSISKVPLPVHVQGVRVLRHRCNLGKGMAIRSGLVHANGEFVIVQDADLELDPAAYELLIAPIVGGCADLVVGTRVAQRHTARVVLYRLGTIGLNVIFWILFGRRLTDQACCFKLLRTTDLRRMQLECEGFEFCSEVVAKASRLGLRFAEVPVTYYPRDGVAGKKLRLRDGLRAFATLWKYRRWQAPKPAHDASPAALADSFD